MFLPDFGKRGTKAGTCRHTILILNMYRLHKMRGGTFTDYQDKTRLPLTDSDILKHLKGEQLIGIYPLLEDNTSWFIAADFDKEKWAQECISLIRILSENGIPAYLERSKSGRGGHVWVFWRRPHTYGMLKRIVVHYQKARVKLTKH